jgi:predicted DNA-binding ribbon-helix-helix protein
LDEGREVDHWRIGAMTQLLQQAIAELHKLPESEQDTIAALILAEIDDERHWDAQFASTQRELAQLVAKVRDDIRTGRVRDMGIDEL